ncbi:MAG: diaminopimelate epimerase [Bacteroidota bacterium]
MLIQFNKYQGTGNDFIIIDNRTQNIKLTEKNINLLCNRRFGIGADGLIMIKEMHGFDFEMDYYNADGRKSTMCGNGGRCIVAFAYSLGLIISKTNFLAIDGPHSAIVLSREQNKFRISLQMTNVSQIISSNENYILNTGSPHFVKFVEEVKLLDVVKEGRKIRYSKEFAEEGINVNFVQLQKQENRIIVRTYERGVEDETLSCGTGVTASALASSKFFEQNIKKINVSTLGGDLTVSFDHFENSFSNIWLEGPVSHVFKGEIDI